jgi:uncharacterized RDD family membrane protein YckC
MTLAIGDAYRGQAMSIGSTYRASLRRALALTGTYLLPDILPSSYTTGLVTMLVSKRTQRLGDIAADALRARAVGADRDWRAGGRHRPRLPPGAA